MQQPILQTERLILEPFKDSDVQDIFNYASNVEVASTTAWHAHKTLEDSHKYLNWIRSQTCFEDGKICFVWAIRDRFSNKVIGSIDFKNIYVHSGQFDYALSCEYWNQGLMTEAAKSIINWAFKTFPRLQRFQAHCMADNIGSRRVMEKAGLEFEGIRLKNVELKGRLIDTAHYALVKK